MSENVDLLGYCTVQEPLYWYFNIGLSVLIWLCLLARKSVGCSSFDVYLYV